MESFDIILGSGLIGAILTGITELGKRVGLTPKVSLAFSSLIMAIAYALFKMAAPMQLQTSVVEFVQVTLGTATVIYLYIVEPLKKD